MLMESDEDVQVCSIVVIIKEGEMGFRIVILHYCPENCLVNVKLYQLLIDKQIFL